MTSMKIKVFLRAPYNYDTDEVSDQTALSCPEEEGMTQQQFKEETDINTIVRKFGLTGELPENVRVPVSGDFTGISDYQTALNAVIAADDAFMELPAEMRAKFGNDPQMLMEFVADERNREEAVKIGLVNKPPEVTRDAVKAIDELREVLTPKPAT